MSAIRLVPGCRSNQWKECRLGPRSMCIAAELRAVDQSSSHRSEGEIGTSSRENKLFIPKMEFSVLTRLQRDLTYEWRALRGTQAVSLPLPPPASRNA